MQDRVVTLALILSETVWIYAIYSVIGLLAGLDRSPVPWLACLILYGGSLYLSRGFWLFKIRPMISFFTQMFCGAILVYLLVGFTSIPDATGFDLAWIFGIDEWAFQFGKARLLVVLSFVMASIAWLRGGRSGASDFPMDSLIFSFRIGVLILAICVTIDMFHSSNLYLNLLMLLFFASSLGGLAVGRIMPVGPINVKGMKWVQIILVMITGVVGTGVLFSSLGHEFLSYISRPIVTLLGWIGIVVIYSIVVPIAYIVEYLLRGLRLILSTLDLREDSIQPLPELGLGEAVQNRIVQTGDKGPSIFGEVVEVVAIFLGVVVVLAVLGLAFKKRVRWVRTTSGESRSSLSEDVDLMDDLLRLGKNLIPSFVKMGSKIGYIIPPDADEGTRVTLLSYYRMLDLGEAKGVNRKYDMTPNEMIPHLSNVLKSNSVEGLTAAFVSVCYGSSGASEEDVEQLREWSTTL